ncbi:MAG: undecaprenyldiphospho-muramoylpentapeptide beta-N-acetylglucosaminyltransferase [Candidatus Aminicenantes bacterium]|jgi:UDP-N-acetylglucosamine--N-acetylmuramyl-(pentapeptide) pyrophosphoryl-undecaprenol N-acetylglucosamine transferase
MNPRNVIISGGGTGGHLYPALAVGEKLREKNPAVEIFFVGSSRLLEKNIMERYQANFIPLNIEGIKGKGLKILKSLVLLPYSFLKSFYILLRLRPALVVGVGGYSSGPIVLLASCFRIPTLIMEQNLKPGLTNRLLLPWVRKAVVAFEGSLPYFKGKGHVVGNPTRDEFYSLPKKERNHCLSLLIFGGSQGSHFLNTRVTESLELLSQHKKSLRFVHQTGENDYEWVKECYNRYGFMDVTVSPYFFNMPDYFQSSDLIVCRSGATTIAELIAAQKASILVPFAKATENHQLINARELERAKAAEILPEEDFTPESFAEKIRDFMSHKDKINRMENNLESLKKENSAEKIADLCLDLMEGVV